MISKDRHLPLLTHYRKIQKLFHINNEQVVVIPKKQMRVMQKVFFKPIIPNANCFLNSRVS
jgi:hypothetical protein